jgi:hypothetical protein
MEERRGKVRKWTDVPLHWPLITKSVCPCCTIKNSDPPLPQKTDSPVLLTAKTIPIKEKAVSVSASASVSVSSTCKGNPNSMREQLSLKTSQGKSKVNI